MHLMHSFSGGGFNAHALKVLADGAIIAASGGVLADVAAAYMPIWSTREAKPITIHGRHDRSRRAKFARQNHFGRTVSFSDASMDTTFVATLQNTAPRVVRKLGL